jgi:hypothetical protein
LNQIRHVVAGRKQANNVAIRTSSVAALAAHATIPAATPPAPQAAWVRDGPGELEVAVSDDGTRVLVASNDGVSFSRDSGATFQDAQIDGCKVKCNGDPSTAVGASGGFYYSWMDGEHQVKVAASKDDLATFQSAGIAASCTPTDCITDQPHIAADRSHRSP